LLIPDVEKQVGHFPKKLIMGINAKNSSFGPLFEHAKKKGGILSKSPTPKKIRLRRASRGYNVMLIYFKDLYFFLSVYPATGGFIFFADASGIRFSFTKSINLYHHSNPPLRCPNPRNVGGGGLLWHSMVQKILKIIKRFTINFGTPQARKNIFLNTNLLVPKMTDQSQIKKKGVLRRFLALTPLMTL
jgi:hypothetical protein